MATMTIKFYNRTDASYLEIENVKSLCYSTSKADDGRRLKAYKLEIVGADTDVYMDVRMFRINRIEITEG